MALVDALIAVSAGGAATFRAAGVDPGKLAIVRNGIFARRRERPSGRLRARLTGAATTRVVLTPARITAQKGHRYLIDAAPAVLRAHPDVHFLLAGDGPLRPGLESRVHDLGLQKHVHFLGMRPDVPALMALAELLVLPSLFEGLPLAVLEAMTCKLPIIATEVIGTTEAVTDDVTARLVPPARPASTRQRPHPGAR